MTAVELSSATSVLVLGAGPAGLAAAAAASERGQLVTLVDDNPHPGGQIWRGGPGQWRDGRADALWTLVCQRPNVRLILGARVLSAPAPQELLLEIEGRAHSIGWQRLILCSGARELLLPFSGWTLPGVTGAGGLQALIKGGMSIAGKRVVVAGSGPLLLAVADTVRRHHGSVVAIAEHRPLPGLVAFFAQLSLRHRGKLWQALGLFRQLAGVRYRTGATVVAATGERQLRSVTLRQGGRQIELACDFLACGYGLVPNLELATLLGCRVDQGKVQVDGEQLSSRANVWAAGEATGIGGVDKALAEGHIAGMRATEGTPAPSVRAARHRALRFAGLLARRFGPTPALRALCKQDTIVCRCEDVLAAQLAEHCDWRTAKVLTRVGMGPCQGRICGAACAFLYGWQTPGLRLPVFPAAASILAAEHSAACTKEIES